jgi:multiple sugar transport system permease protein
MTTTAPPAARPAGSRAATTTRGRRDGWAALGFLAPSGVGFLVFTFLPIVGSIALAFFAWPVLGQRSFSGLANFTTLFTSDPVFFRVMRNTVVFVLLYVPLNFVVSLGLAVWISPRIRGRSLYRMLFFLPAVTPVIANALVWKMMLQPGGLLEGYLQQAFGIAPPNVLGEPVLAMLAVVAMSVWMGFGYNMLVFSAGLDAIPDALYDAAAIDGAGPIRRFWSITIPMLSPSMFFAAVLTLITSFQVFGQPYILTAGGPGVSTTTMVMYLYQKGFQFFELGMASAIASVLFLMIVMVTGMQFVAQRRWVHYDG